MIRYHLRRKTWREKHKSAEGTRKVNDASPKALAVHYTTAPTGASDGTRRCGGCDFYAGSAQSDDGWAACWLLESRLVPRTGRCDAWVAKVEFD